MEAKLLRLVNEIGGYKVMVIGDMVADLYLDGRISRISREAPVLVLEHAGETVVPGGAANVAHNAATLGGDVFAVGVVGSDSAGETLTRELQGKRVRTEGLIVDTARPTITKTRVMAGGLATVRQQVVRIDRESRAVLDTATQKNLCAYVEKNIGAMAAVVMSDYGSSTVFPALSRYVVAACQKLNIPCVVDSRYNILAFEGATVVKQNESEAAAATGRENLDGDALMAAGFELLERLGAQAVLITQGPDGMSLFQPHNQVTHIPVTNISEVFDVSGAGDTVVITVAMALAAGATYGDAARLANFAAGVVVKKPGTATVCVEELREVIGAYHETDSQG